MYKKTTVTIGIPAHNEEANIGFLINQLLAQKQTKYKIDQIIVASDNSTDKTVKIVKNINSPIVHVIDSKTRIGKPLRENQIKNISKSDILVLLDADIQLDGDEFIKKVIRPIEEGADLASCRVLALNPETLVENILNQSIIFQDKIISKFAEGDNVYTCHGTTLVMSKKLYTSINFPNSIGEDAFAYFYCRRNNFKYKFTSDAFVYIKLPTNLKDHLKQSRRFNESREMMYKEFEGYPPLETYNISAFGNLKELIFSVFNSPIYFSLYLALNIYSRLITVKKVSRSATWDIAASSKHLV